MRSELGEANGRKAAIAPNGTMIDLSHNQGEVLDVIETGRTYLDGSALIGSMDGVVRERVRMALRGHVSVSVVIDEDNRPLDGVWVELLGVPELHLGSLQEDLEEAIEADLSRAKRKDLVDDDAVIERVSRVVRKVCNEQVGKKPLVTVMTSRLA